MKLYFDSLTTLKVIHAESPIVIFLGHMDMELSKKLLLSLQITESIALAMQSFQKHSVT